MGQGRIVPEYTILSVLGLAAVIVLELRVLRTGLFRMPVYWASMVIILFFQCLVDGWLTKLSAPIVLYDPDQILGLRFPWDIPVEDFVFGTAMVTLALLMWVRLTGRAAPRGRGTPAAHPAPDREDPR